MVRDCRIVGIQLQHLVRVFVIQSMAASTIERLESDRQPVCGHDNEWNIAGTLPIDDRKEAIRRGGYALVVSDYDQDGLNDMLVEYGPINLLRNTGNGLGDVT